MTGSGTSPEQTEPAALARRRDAVYEVNRDYVRLRDSNLAIGYSVDVCGIPDEHECKFSPGCSECQHTYDDLRSIAEAAIAGAGPDVQFEIEEFDDALYESAKRDFRAEVHARVNILHREKVNEPIGDDEESALKGFEGKLRELGVRHG
jgi:hypothetical protein